VTTNAIIKVDKEVIDKYHKKLIDNIRSRGYSLYYAGEAGFSFINEEDIKECVLRGSEKEYLISGAVYQVLPYTENSSDWDEVKKLMVECITTYRYPFWADIVSGIEEDENGNKKEYAKVVGVYLVDSIIFDEEDNFFELVTDVLLMHQLGIVQEQEGNIILDLIHVDKVLKQLTLRTKKDKSDLISVQAQGNLVG
jgi:hypothetical protein